jgi:hypothetical protein
MQKQATFENNTPRMSSDVMGVAMRLHTLFHSWSAEQKDILFLRTVYNEETVDRSIDRLLAWSPSLAIDCI